jgi:hypothetical protein
MHTYPGNQLYSVLGAPIWTTVSGRTDLQQRMSNTKPPGLTNVPAGPAWSPILNMLELVATAELQAEQRRRDVLTSCSRRKICGQGEHWHRLCCDAEPAQPNVRQRTFQVMQAAHCRQAGKRTFCKRGTTASTDNSRCRMCGCKGMLASIQYDNRSGSSSGGCTVE